MNLYKEIYCGIYRVCFRKVDIGNYSATILLSALIFLNLMTALGVLQLVGLVKMDFLSRTTAMLLSAIIGFINLYYFNFSKRDEKLISKTKNQTGYIGDVYAVVYGVTSIVIAFKVTTLVREENIKLVETTFNHFIK